MRRSTSQDGDPDGGWLIIVGLFVLGFTISIIMAARWGRGSYEGMPIDMESESASYMNYSRGPHIGF